MGISRLKYSRLRLTKVERGGFFMLLLLMFSLIILETRPSSTDLGMVELNSEEVQAWLLTYDSLESAQRKRRNKIFPFNPNFISPAKADRLGLTAEEFRRFQEFRSSGNWINTTEDFQRVTGVSQIWMKQYASLFKFPDFLKEKTSALQQSQNKIFLSQANEQQLMRIKGIGPVMARRIIRARDQWGGIGSEHELMLIHGLNTSLVDALMRDFLYDQKLITPRNINKLFPVDLAELPGIDFALTKRIWEFVRLRQGLQSLEELHFLEEIQPRLFEVIQLYLYAMKN